MTNEPRIGSASDSDHWPLTEAVQRQLSGEQAYTPDGSLGLTAEEFALLQEMFRWRDESCGLPRALQVMDRLCKLCEMIEERTGISFAQYT